jgi:lysine 2-monooxygenase
LLWQRLGNRRCAILAISLEHCGRAIVTSDTNLAAHEPLDVAVVGCGIAGLYAASRLLEEKAVSPSGIALFEAGDRAGGRIKSFNFPQAVSPRVDLGAMMFSPRSHRRVARLIRKLGITTEKLATQSGSSPLEFRGRHLLQREVHQYALHPLFPFGVRRRDQTKGPLKLLREAANRIVGDIRSVSPSDWHRLHSHESFKARPLRNWGTYEALSLVLAPEQFAFLEARVGFSMYTRAPSLLNALAMIADLLEMGGQFETIPGGMEALAAGVVESLARFGCRPLLGMKLDAIDLPNSDGDRDGDPILLRFKSADGGEREISANRVILALPRRAIELIEAFPARERIRALLSAVEPWPFGKALLLYETQWWRENGISSGFALSDRSIGQVWYFGGSTRAASLGHGVLVSIFDGYRVADWRRLASGGEAAGQGLTLFDQDHPCTKALHAEIKRLHEPLDVERIPRPIGAALQDWNTDPFGGATHVWARGIDRHSVASDMLQPIPEARLYVCGEAWSHRQGWIEGALETADALLERHFGLPQPADDQAARSMEMAV